MKVSVTLFGTTFNIPGLIQLIIAILTMILPFFTGIQVAKMQMGKKQPAVLAPPRPNEPGRVYSTGRIEPKNIKQLIEDDKQRHEGIRNSIPHAAQPTYNCVELGYVPPIVDQGNCGSCWDFSGTGVCDCANIIAGYGKNDGTFKLSEQFIIDCTSNGGCNGDDNTTVLIYAKSNGLPLSSAYGPYTAHDGQCHDTGQLKHYNLSDWGFCAGQGLVDTQTIKDYMVKYGPIGAAIAADNAFMDNTPGTVFQGSGARNINHDIILVGWDDSKQAWLLRNSWGTGWCDNGYCWIKYGANQVGTEAVWAYVVPLPSPATGGSYVWLIIAGVICLIPIAIAIIARLRMQRNRTV